MKRSIWVCMFAFAAACGVSSPVDTGDQGTADSVELSASPDPSSEARAVSTRPSAEESALLAAAATGDPAIMAQAVAASATCHGTVTCTGFGSCGTFSAAAACGAKACGSTGCGPRCLPGDPDCTQLRPLVQRFEKYRVCQNQLAESCVEWAAGPSTSTCSEACAIGGPAPASE